MKSRTLEATKTKTKSKINLDPLADHPNNLPAASVGGDKDTPTDNRTTSNSPKFNRASAAQTLRKTSQITPNADMSNMLSRMRDIEADHDDPGYPEPIPTTPENLPAVINKSIVRAGYQHPDWHTVATLPGNMAQGIRTLGRQLFRSFTRTPTDKIIMIGNVMGQGPNTSAEINAVAGWIVNNGTKITTGDIDFNRIMPGYSADIQQWDCDGARFLIVKDQFGKYIYSWPSSESVGISAQRRLK